MSDVILVNEKDEEIGTCEKLKAHQEGLLHRAFSVFIIRDKEILLQKRHSGKYHSGGLWTNTCCSHPEPHETILVGGKRRLKEEMGIEADLKEIGLFHYTAKVGNNLIENEMDHVLVGEKYSGDIMPDPQEIEEFKWVNIQYLRDDIQQNPQRYTAWLEKALAFL